MSRSWVRVSGAILALSAGLCLATPVTAQNFGDKLPCGDTVPKKLSSLGFDKSQIDKVLSEEEWTNSRLTDTFQGWTAWVQPKTCTGQIVVKLTAMCVVESVYTTGPCSFKGISQE